MMPWVRGPTGRVPCHATFRSRFGRQHHETERPLEL